MQLGSWCHRKGKYRKKLSSGSDRHVHLIKVTADQPLSENRTARGVYRKIASLVIKGHIESRNELKLI